MPATYEPIATTTLSTTAATIDFTSIPSSYTDLRVVLVATGTTAVNPQLRLNANANSVYSDLSIFGDGASASTTRTSNNDVIRLYTLGLSTTIPSLYTIDIFSYNDAINKTVLFTASEDRNGSGNVTNGVALYRSTTAITQVNLRTSSSTFASGTTATLYGILKA